MDMAVILVMWPWPFEGTFVTPPHWASTWNLASIENIDRRTTYDDAKYIIGSGELKPKYHGRTHGWTDSVKTVYPPQTQFAGGIYV